MSRKAFIWWGMIIGSTVGGYAPVMFGEDMLSFAGVIGGVVGGLVGIWLGAKAGSKLGT
jgi:hypothetical protein